LFIYYCALCGAWAALFGWALGRLLGVTPNEIANAGIKGFALGFFVSLALGLVDAFMNLSSFKQMFVGIMRVGVAVMVGSIGGMMGGMFGQILFGMKDLSLFLILGWTVTGFLIGISVGVFDIASRFMRQEDIGGALRKIVNGALGGTVGGLLGAVLLIALHGVWSNVFSGKPSTMLWSPSSTGFIALGMCIGLLIGLAQIILKEAWVKVETGRRAGKEMIVAKKEFTLGRAEACDLGLFGDPSIEKMHARIVRQGNRYYLADLNTPGGTFLNGQRVREPMPLRDGDAIRVGSCTVRFGERAKR
jgi:FHA domain-containing protein